MPWCGAVRSGVDADRKYFANQGEELMFES